MSERTELTDERIQQLIGASDAYWASNRLVFLSIARLIEAEVRATIPADVGREAAARPTPYGLAGIEGDAIVIRFTADAAAFAFEHDPQAQSPQPPVTDKAAFLRDVLDCLTSEREDGATLLTDALDRAMRKAAEQGSEGIDYDASLQSALEGSKP